MSYNIAMITYSELATCISGPRLKRYLLACNGDENNAVELYFATSKLMSIYFALVTLFEVVLRNRLDWYLSTRFKSETNQWLVYLAQSGSIIDVGDNPLHKDLKKTFNEPVIFTKQNEVSFAKIDEITALIIHLTHNLGINTTIYQPFIDDINLGKHHFRRHKMLLNSEIDNQKPTRVI
jgi:hypothetical protein